MNRRIVITCTPLTYYSPYDEEAFFHWINKLSCIEKYEGVGRELHIYIESPNIPREELIGLIGLFKRYKFKDPQQLHVFKNENNKRLFGEK